MKLKVALSQIEDKMSDGEVVFAILRNINTGMEIFIGGNSEGEPIVIEKAGLTKKEWEEDGYSDDTQYAGSYLSKHKYTIEEVTDHQYGVHFLKECPVSTMRNNLTVLRPGLTDLSFKV